jgi:hypothetical protein
MKEFLFQFTDFEKFGEIFSKNKIYSKLNLKKQYVPEFSLKNSLGFRNTPRKKT